MKTELGYDLPMEEVKSKLRGHIAALFGMTIV